MVQYNSNAARVTYELNRHSGMATLPTPTPCSRLLGLLYLVSRPTSATAVSLDFVACTRDMKQLRQSNSCFSRRPPLSVTLQISIHKDVVALLFEAGTSNAGLIHPAVLGPGAVTILIRVVLEYTEVGDDGIESDGKTAEFDAAVEPEHWTNHPCNHLQQDCIVFQNDKLRLFASNALGEAGVLSIKAFGKFTTGSTVNVISTSCDIRCHTPGACDDFETEYTIDLDPEAPGTDVGTVVQSTLSDGSCMTSMFDDLHIRVRDA